MLDNKDMLKRWHLMKGRYKFSLEEAKEFYRKLLENNNNFKPNLP